MGRMADSDLVPGISAFVAIGDSFTEGLHDPDPGGGFRGWADRVADALAARQPGFRYANRGMPRAAADRPPPAGPVDTGPGARRATPWPPLVPGVRGDPDD